MAIVHDVVRFFCDILRMKFHKYLNARRLCRTFLVALYIMLFSTPAALAQKDNFVRDTVLYNTLFKYLNEHSNSFSYDSTGKLVGRGHEKPIMIVCWNLKLRDDTIVANKNFPGVYAFRFACSHCSQIEFYLQYKKKIVFINTDPKKLDITKIVATVNIYFNQHKKEFSDTAKLNTFENLMDALRHKVETLEQLLPKDY
jgi:hypothetical protein